MLSRDGLSIVHYAPNVNVFPDTVALFKSD